MTTSLSRHDRVQSADALPARSWHLLVLSARSVESLEAATVNLVEHLRRNPDVDIADVAFTLQAGRQLFEKRRIAVCRDVPDAIDALDSKADARVYSIAHATKPPRVAFVFTGGALSSHAVRELYQAEAVFAREVDRMAEESGASVGLDLRHLLDSGDDPQEPTRASQDDAAGTQAARFAFEYALAKLWESWGVTPAAVMGLGTGAYASACLAGVIELQEAMALAVNRGRVLSGELEPSAFAKLTKSVRHRPAQLPCVSSVTGVWMSKEEASDPSYWLRQLQWTSTVEASIQTLASDDIGVLLQLGSGECLPRQDPDRRERLSIDETGPLCVHSVPASPGQYPPMRALTEALGRLYAAGVPIDWSAFNAGREPQRTPLPSYPFERHRCWFAVESRARSEQPGEAARAPDACTPTGRQAFVGRTRENSGNPHVSPRNEVEKALVDLCQDLLGVAGVGIYDNVIALGADSLFTMRLSRQIGEIFGVTISPHHLFAEPNLASLASTIQQRGPSSARPEQRPEAISVDRPATHSTTRADYDRILTFVEGLSEGQVAELLHHIAGERGSAREGPE